MSGSFYVVTILFTDVLCATDVLCCPWPLMLPKPIAGREVDFDIIVCQTKKKLGPARCIHFYITVGVQSLGYGIPFHVSNRENHIHRFK